MSCVGCQELLRVRFVFASFIVMAAFLSRGDSSDDDRDSCRQSMEDGQSFRLAWKMANRTPNKDDAATGSAPTMPPMISPTSPMFEAPWNKTIESDDDIADVVGGYRVACYV